MACKKNVSNKQTNIFLSATAYVITSRSLIWSADSLIAQVLLMFYTRH